MFFQLLKSRTHSLDTHTAPPSLVRLVYFAALLNGYFFCVYFVEELYHQSEILTKLFTLRKFMF